MNALRLTTMLLLPIFLLPACGGGDDDNLDDRLDLAQPKVRFVQATEFAPDLTLYRNDAAQADATNVGYKFASQYFDVSTDTDKWDISTADSTATDLSTQTFDAGRGDKYTIVALPGSGNLVDSLVIEDPFNKGLLSDKARVRIVNASVNAQNVDVYLTAPTVDLATVAPNFPAVAFKTAQPSSGNDSAEFDGGTYQLRITSAGTKNVIFSAPVTLADNADWLILSIPSGGLNTLVPDDIKVLVAKSDDSAQATLEIESE